MRTTLLWYASSNTFDFSVTPLLSKYLYKASNIRRTFYDNIYLEEMINV